MKTYINFLDKNKFKNEHTLMENCFEDLQIGIVFFNENINIISQNAVAKQFTKEICGSVYTYNLFDKLAEQLNFQDISKQNTQLSYKDFELFFTTVIDDFTLQKTTMLTIKKATAEPHFEGINLNALSKRELQIAECITKGYSYQKTADELFISINTVRRHLKNIYKKLDINNQRSLSLKLLHNQSLK